MWGIVIVALIEIPKLKNTQNTVFQWLIEYLQFWHWQISPQYKTHFKEKKALIALTIPFFYSRFKWLLV